MHPAQEVSRSPHVSELAPTDDEPVSSTDEAIGERIRLAMWRARVTQVQLAEALNLDQAAVSRRLRGLVAWRVTDVYTAARLVRVPARDLLPPEGDELAAAASP